MEKMEMGSVVVCLGAKIVYSSQSEFKAGARRGRRVEGGGGERKGDELIGFLGLDGFLGSADIL